MGEELNWVARRGVFDADLPTFWGKLCVDLEDAVRTFDVKHGGEQKASTTCYRKGDCLHVSYEPNFSSEKGSPSPREIDLCLDRKNKAVISRNKSGVTESSVRMTAGTDGKALAVNSAGEPMTNDQVSQALLESFLFPN